jgi:hypothetical protein
MKVNIISLDPIFLGDKLVHYGKSVLMEGMNQCYHLQYMNYNSFAMKKYLESKLGLTFYYNTDIWCNLSFLRGVQGF